MATIMTDAITLLSHDLDDNWQSITTAAGNANKLTIVDDNLYEKVSDWVNDGMIVYLPSTGETRVVDNLLANTITVKAAFANLVGSGVVYEIHRLFTRNQKLTALRQAAVQICPEVHAVVRTMPITTVNFQFEYDLSSLGIFNNRPHQLLLSQFPINDIWESRVAYIVGDFVRPTTLAAYTGYSYECTVPGTSGSSEPSWPTTLGGTVTDNGVTWTCNGTLDYSNYPFLPLHDWDITPDGHLLLNANYPAGYKLMVVGIKPLSFTGSGSSETIALDSPFTQVLSAQAALYLCQQKVFSAGTQDVARWLELTKSWQAELATRKQKYWMKPPDGTMISGGGLTV